MKFPLYRQPIENPAKGNSIGEEKPTCKAVFRYSVEYRICKACFNEVVGQNGLEPSTSRLSVVCSSQLSYWPIWWRLAGSNR